MPADPHIYASKRLAHSYANYRPPIHRLVCERIKTEISGDRPFDSVLDVGCGAGSSTSALLTLAKSVHGIDPYEEMIAAAKKAVPGASFARGQVERIPFGSGCFQLVTAAGCLNYADTKTALQEIDRVLDATGHLAAYDFSAGKSIPNDSQLSEQFSLFRQHFPSPLGYALNLEQLPYRDANLENILYSEFDVEIPMSGPEYIQYLLGDAGVETAVRGGASVAQTEILCSTIFSSVFGKSRRSVVFNVQLAIARKYKSASVRNDA
jgi:SAM-dependent methyltransferase